MKLKVETHFNEPVITNLDTDNMRKTECMCLNCGIMNDCESAKKFYAICCDNNIALMVTRCRNFKE